MTHQELMKELNRLLSVIFDDDTEKPTAKNTGR